MVNMTDAEKHIIRIYITNNHTHMGAKPPASCSMAAALQNGWPQFGYRGG